MLCARNLLSKACSLPIIFYCNLYDMLLFMNCHFQLHKSTDVVWCLALYLCLLTSTKRLLPSLLAKNTIFTINHLESQNFTAYFLYNDLRRLVIPLHAYFFRIWEEIWRGVKIFCVLLSTLLLLLFILGQWIE